MSGVRNLAILIVVLGLILWAAGPGWAAPMGTAFSYQGQLMDAGSPAEGIYDFKFELYDEPDGGIQHGHPLLIDDVGVMGGGFTVSLDFGDDPNVFNGEARWLQMGVRPGEMSGPGDYMILMPRQQLTATPYALALRGFRTEHNEVSPNVIGGWKGNSIAPGVVGATITGGGAANSDANGPGSNHCYDNFCWIGGGDKNQAGSNDSDATSDQYATVAGGYKNNASGKYSTIGGGEGNSAFIRCTVAGGSENAANGQYDAIGGGAGNTAGGAFTTVGGGWGNQVNGWASTIGGGQDNKIGVDGGYAAIAGGCTNGANAYYATVPGGSDNTADGKYSLAAGRRAKANHQGAFVWADSQDADFASMGDNQFLIRAAGGVGIGTNNPGAKLDVNGETKISGKSTGANPILKVVNNASGTAHGITAYSGTGSNSWGIYGEGKGSGGGICAVGNGWHGVYGLCKSSHSDHAGVCGRNTGGGWAGYFDGDVHVTGKLSKGSGSFKIDHPLDPENKYLSHSFVESPEMKNVYDGVVKLDDNGQASVELPAYFEALNSDFRYQLTAIGAPAPNLYIAGKISNNCFKIAGGRPNMEVSWQVTGIRQDAYAIADPVPVEQEKAAQERGYYLHPKAYGLPREKSIEFARNGQVSETEMMAKHVR